MVVMVLMLGGCNSGDSYAAYQSVKKKYPNSDIRNVPGKSFSFIVKTPEGGIIYVETLNITDDEISKVSTIFGDNLK